MTLHKPWLMQPVIADPDLTWTAQEIRMVMPAVQAKWWDGPAGAGDFLVTQRGAGANFSVDVAAGVCQTTGDDIAGQGCYYTWNDATVNVTCPAAPGSGTRVHRLVLQVRDKQSNGTWTTYDAVLVLLQDTGGGTPAEPPSATTLALISETVSQASITNANITDLRVAGRVSWVTPALQGFSSSSDVAVTGITAIGVRAGNYRCRGVLRFQNGGGSTAARVKLQATGGITAMSLPNNWWSEGTGGTVNPAVQNALNTAIQSPSYAASAFYQLWMDGTLTIAAPGEFGLTNNSSTGGTINLQAGSFLDLWPVL